MRRYLPLVPLLLFPHSGYAADSVAYITQVGVERVITDPIRPNATAGATETAGVSVSSMFVADAAGGLVTREFLDGAGNSVEWTHGGGQVQLQVSQSGHDNVVVAGQQGTDQRISISQSGNGNHVSALQSGSGNRIVIVQR